MKRMNEIRSVVAEKLRNMIRDENVELEEVDVVKLNDLYHYGISFRSGDVGKTLYINDFMADDKTAEDIAEEMLNAYENSVDAPPWVLMNELQVKQDLSDIAADLFVVLLEVRRNENYLQDIPYREVGFGLAYICQIRHMDPYGNGFMSTAVTKSLIDSNEWDPDALFDIAISNTLRNDAPTLHSIENALVGNPENLLESNRCCPESLLILTNRSGVFGAAALFLPDIIDRIHSCIGNSFFAIPSSIHEIIIVPESNHINAEALSAMCREANSTVVELKDILSDHVMHFPMK